LDDVVASRETRKQESIERNEMKWNNVYLVPKNTKRSIREIVVFPLLSYCD
jgi:hypothetical protein